MSIASLVIPHPAPSSSPTFGVRDQREAAERVASILGKYATDFVAIDAGNMVRIDTDHLPWPCEPGERARRLAVLASAWTGTTVAVSVQERPKPSTPEGPYVARLSARTGESLPDFRERILRAAERLAAMLEVGGQICHRWMVRLERDGNSAVMPLPGGSSGAPAEAIERRLPTAALAGVNSIRLEARTRPAPRRREAGIRAPVHLPRRPEALPLVS